MPTSLVIGANRGIGLELARQLAAKRHRVIATCRKPSPELEALDTFMRLEGIDVTDQASVDRLAEEIAGKSVDNVLINAGVLRRMSLDAIDYDAVRLQLEVNAIGPLRVAAAVWPKMDTPGKIVILTSRMGSMGDNESGGSYGYRMSKAAVNAVGVSLARDLKDRNIAVAMLHPGWVKTDMTGGTGNVTPAESASMLLERLEDLELDHSGVFWHADGEELPW